MTPFTVLSFNPRFRMVSIIPGIENIAPDLTETNNGLTGSPNPLLVMVSNLIIFFSVSSMTFFGKAFLFL